MEVEIKAEEGLDSHPGSFSPAIGCPNNSRAITFKEPPWSSGAPGILVLKMKGLWGRAEGGGGGVAGHCLHDLGPTEGRV